jgi:general secretion pathway protein D
MVLSQFKAPLLANTATAMLLMALMGGFGVTASAAEQAAQPSQTWTVNFKDTDIGELIRFVAKATGKTIIIDPKVKGKVQVISARPVSTDELYELFLSILEIHEFTAVDSGGVTRIIPSKDARTAPVKVMTSQNLGESSEIITQVIQLENISAAKLIPVLRPLAPQQAHMAAYAPSNAIILSDTAANINRIKKVIESIDLSAVANTDIIALEHASAEEVVRMLEQLKKSESAKGQAETKTLILVADKRTNSVLVTGDELERQRIKTLIDSIDTPLAQSGNVQVIYLEYAQSTDLAAVLTKVVQNMERMSGQDTVKSSNKNTATIEADEGTNSLIVTAEADVMQSLISVVKRLDIRRAQVLVEAIIVEMTDDDGRDLGVEWLFLNDSGGYGSSTNAGLGGAIASAAFETDSNGDPVDSRAGIAGVLGSTAGQVLGIGRLDDNFSFNVAINALQSNTEANILSTPSLLTLDNEEASIVVGQSIPFVTGSFTSTGNSSSNPDNPFQTVERENVGITLKVTPQINEGDSVILAISQEVSNVVGGSAVLNSNVITSERKIETKILADNGQTIVLGGLIEDQISETVQRVPVLGSIPIIGSLFRSTSTQHGKKHLLVFLRPTIVRDKRQMDSATAGKYRLIRERQLQEIAEGVGLIDDNSLPLLPEWQEQLEQLQELRDEQAIEAAEDSKDATQ